MLLEPLLNAEAKNRRSQRETYLEALHSQLHEHSQEEMDRIEEFISDFEECDKIRREYPETVGVFYDDLVPRLLSHQEFWQRYFYRCHPDSILKEWALLDIRQKVDLSLKNCRESLSTRMANTELLLKKDVSSKDKFLRNHLNELIDGIQVKSKVLLCNGGEETFSHERKMILAERRPTEAETSACRARKSTYSEPLLSESKKCTKEEGEKLNTFLTNCKDIDLNCVMCEEVCKFYPHSVGRFYKELVPAEVSHDDFWKRYIYRCDPDRISRLRSSKSEGEKHHLPKPTFQIKDLIDRNIKEEKKEQEISEIPRINQTEMERESFFENQGKIVKGLETRKTHVESKVQNEGGNGSQSQFQISDYDLALFEKHCDTQVESKTEKKSQPELPEVVDESTDLININFDESTFKQHFFTDFPSNIQEETKEKDNDRFGITFNDMEEILRELLFFEKVKKKKSYENRDKILLNHQELPSIFSHERASDLLMDSTGKSKKDYDPAKTTSICNVDILSMMEEILFCETPSEREAESKKVNELIRLKSEVKGANTLFEEMRGKLIKEEAEKPRVLAESEQDRILECERLQYEARLAEEKAVRLAKEDADRAEEETKVTEEGKINGTFSNEEDKMSLNTLPIERQQVQGIELCKTTACLEKKVSVCFSHNLEEEKEIPSERDCLGQKCSIMDSNKANPNPNASMLPQSTMIPKENKIKNEKPEKNPETNGKAKNHFLPVEDFVGPMPIAKKSPLERLFYASESRKLSNTQRYLSETISLKFDADSVTSSLSASLTKENQFYRFMARNTSNAFERNNTMLQHQEHDKIQNYTAKLQEYKKDRMMLSKWKRHVTPPKYTPTPPEHTPTTGEPTERSGLNLLQENNFKQETEDKKVSQSCTPTQMKEKEQNNETFCDPLEDYAPYRLNVDSSNKPKDEIELSRSESLDHVSLEELTKLVSFSFEVDCGKKKAQKIIEENKVHPVPEIDLYSREDMSSISGSERIRVRVDLFKRDVHWSERLLRYVWGDKRAKSSLLGIREHQSRESLKSKDLIDFPVNLEKADMKVEEWERQCTSREKNFDKHIQDSTEEIYQLWKKTVNKVFQRENDTTSLISLEEGETTEDSFKSFESLSLNYDASLEDEAADWKVKKNADIGPLASDAIAEDVIKKNGIVLLTGNENDSASREENSIIEDFENTDNDNSIEDDAEKENRRKSSANGPNYWRNGTTACPSKGENQKHNSDSKNEVVSKRTREVKLKEVYDSSSVQQSTSEGQSLRMISFNVPEADLLWENTSSTSASTTTKIEEMGESITIDPVEYDRVDLREESKEERKQPSSLTPLDIQSNVHLRGSEESESTENLLISPLRSIAVTAEAKLRRGRKTTYTTPIRSRKGFHTFSENEDYIEFLLIYRRKFHGGKENYNKICMMYQSTVGKFFGELVPTEVSNEDSWQRYFYRCDTDGIIKQWDRRA